METKNYGEWWNQVIMGKIPPTFINNNTEPLTSGTNQSFIDTLKELVQAEITAQLNQMVVLMVERTDPASTFPLPKKKIGTDGGYDLFCPTTVDIRPGERVAIRLGIKVGLPVGYMGIFHDKSGWAYNKGLHVLAGLIDATFTGELLAVVLNTGEDMITVQAGAPIVQMYVQKILNTVVCEMVVENTEGGRNEAGFTSGK